MYIKPFQITLTATGRFVVHTRRAFRYHDQDTQSYTSTGRVTQYLTRIQVPVKRQFHPYLGSSRLLEQSSRNAVELNLDQQNICFHNQSCFHCVRICCMASFEYECAACELVIDITLYIDVLLRMWNGKINVLCAHCQIVETPEKFRFIFCKR